MKPVVTWIVLANGDKAQFYANNGPGKGLEHLTKHDMDQAILQKQDILTDRPGRSFASVGPGRSAMETHTDPVAHREGEFTREVAAKLSEHARNKDYDRVIIAAAPRALGNLRSHLDQHVKDKLIGEVDKDLVNVPENDLAKHFDGLIVP